MIAKGDSFVEIHLENCGKALLLNTEGQNQLLHQTPSLQIITHSTYAATHLWFLLKNSRWDALSR